MTESKVMPPALFKATVDSAALGLAEELTVGFTVNDVAAVMGCGDISPKFRKRVRDRLITLCNNGRLINPRYGIYLASDQISVAVVTSHDPVLVGDLHRAFISEGGFMQMPDILAAVGLEDGGAERRVRAVMSESPMFDRFTPLKGMRKHWRLSDSERAAVPVPGRWLMADLQLMAFRVGRGRIPWNRGLGDALEARRVRIGNGLRDARLLWGWSPEEMVEDAGLSSALDICFSGATSLPYQDPNYPEVSDYKVVDWWGDCKSAMGERDALAEAWYMLEGGGGHPYLLDALDVATWVAIGARTNLDPALLSRGAHDINWRGP